METIITQKMSNTGSIYDLASDQYDRCIAGRGNYAVVLAAYYGGRGYTTHLTEGGVFNQIKKIKNYSYKIIDNDQNRYVIDGDRLIML